MPDDIMSIFLTQPQPDKSRVRPVARDEMIERAMEGGFGDWGSVLRRRLERDIVGMEQTLDASMRFDRSGNRLSLRGVHYED